MKKIGELFEKPIDRPIEEVIKVDQANEKVVATEIDEYVVTNSIREQFSTVYREIAEGPAVPREGIGIWISGFFGSGKSSFAKILGYTAANRKVGDTSASDLFKRICSDRKVIDLLDSINTRIPFHSVIFDVSMDRGVRIAADRLTEIMYRALLRELGYAEDFDLAELEITLESDQRLEQFEKEFQSGYKGEKYDWAQQAMEYWPERVKKNCKTNKSFAIAHCLEQLYEEKASPPKRGRRRTK